MVAHPTLFDAYLGRLTLEVHEIDKEVPVVGETIADRGLDWPNVYPLTRSGREIDDQVRPIYDLTGEACQRERDLVLDPFKRVVADPELDAAGSVRNDASTGLWTRLRQR